MASLECFLLSHPWACPRQRVRVRDIDSRILIHFPYIIGSWGFHESLTEILNFIAS